MLMRMGAVGSRLFFEVEMGFPNRFFPIVAEDNETAEELMRVMEELRCLWDDFFTKQYMEDWKAGLIGLKDLQKNLTTYFCPRMEIV